MATKRKNIKQMRSNEALEMRKAKRRIIKQTGTVESGITRAMVDESLLASAIDRIGSILPKRYVRPPFLESTNVEKPWSNLPYVPLKRFVNWLQPKQQDRKVALSLTSELEEFYKYVTFQPPEESCRKFVLEHITEAITCKYPKAIVSTFGSYALDLSVFNSDIDISILGVGVEEDDDKGLNEEEADCAAAAAEASIEGESDGEDIEIKWFVDSKGDRDDEITSTSPAACKIVNSVNGPLKRKRLSEPIYIADSGSGSEDDSEQDEHFLDCDSEDMSSAAEMSKDHRKRPRLESDLDIHVDSMASRPSSQNHLGTATLSEKRLKLKQLDILRNVFKHIKTLGWVRFAELRTRAKVPIINIEHESGIQCDISLGVTSKDTIDKVRDLDATCPAAFRPLSAFLKIFINQYGLDKPFTGGIGSFKLYAMVAYILTKMPPVVLQSAKPDLGFILASFLKFYGNPTNFNRTTTLSVLGVEVSFEHTSRIHICQRLFAKAHEVLLSKVQTIEAKQHLSDVETLHLGSSIIEADKGDAQSALSTSKSYVISNSTLGALLNTQSLSKYRSSYSEKCGTCSIFTLEERMRIADEIIAGISSKQQDKFPLAPFNIDDVRRCNPAIACRLLSYSNAKNVLSRLVSPSPGPDAFAREGNYNPKVPFGGFHRDRHSTAASRDPYSNFSAGYDLPRRKPPYRKDSRSNKTYQGKPKFKENSKHRRKSY